MKRSEIGMHIGVPVEDLMKGPQVQWNHVDGPLMTWAGRMRLGLE